VAASTTPKQQQGPRLRTKKAASGVRAAAARVSQPAVAAAVDADDERLVDLQEQAAALYQRINVLSAVVARLPGLDDTLSRAAAAAAAATLTSGTESDEEWTGASGGGAAATGAAGGAAADSPLRASVSKRQRLVAPPPFDRRSSPSEAVRGASRGSPVKSGHQRKQRLSDVEESEARRAKESLGSWLLAHNQGQQQQQQDMQVGSVHQHQHHLQHQQQRVGGGSEQMTVLQAFKDRANPRAAASSPAAPPSTSKLPELAPTLSTRNTATDDSQQFLIGTRATRSTTAGDAEAMCGVTGGGGGAGGARAARAEQDDDALDAEHIHVLGFDSRRGSMLHLNRGAGDGDDGGDGDEDDGCSSDSSIASRIAARARLFFGGAGSTTSSSSAAGGDGDADAGAEDEETGVVEGSDAQARPAAHAHLQQQLSSQPARSAAPQPDHSSDHDEPQQPLTCEQIVLQFEAGLTNPKTQRDLARALMSPPQSADAAAAGGMTVIASKGLEGGWMPHVEGACCVCFGWFLFL